MSKIHAEVRFNYGDGTYIVTSDEAPLLLAGRGELSEAIEASRKALSILSDSLENNLEDGQKWLDKRGYTLPLILGGLSIVQDYSWYDAE